MKYLNYISTFLFAGFLKINAQDCNVVNGVLSGFGYKVNQDTDCCTYAVNDQYSVSCDGNAVTGLSIINNGAVNNIPDEVLKLSKLEKLDFSNCQISQFPSKLKSLPNLKSLYLWKNNIKQLPNDISELKSLEHLDLGENYLTSIPDTIGQMENLQSLLLYNNDISALPESIYKLNKLKTLNLESNQNLSGIFKSFGKKVDSCNIKNTHLCIDAKKVCDKYIVNNNDNKPFCHPEDNDSDNSSVTTVLIVIGVIALLLILAVVGYFLYKKFNKQVIPSNEDSVIERKPINKSSTLDSSLIDINDEKNVKDVTDEQIIKKDDDGIEKEEDIKKEVKEGEHREE
ncbi:L domain-like protein [Neocallimastix lanati (nom. inval.)]|jgi:hypothetical protein|uniref:L domain-like protein n=1 Tax=Neocallimastix californiae TaxID=1754190 RepID=A0A1Y2ANM1_9FUNG|nr:L domain-like protein [Neocallimastix sp. JGI-2020a]ORY24151.1 L domain-like protein [Neocallimastix californiae]|eukprot:ORY24151.1 L domain-like protein [Neocallimastix californiae]